MGDFDFSVALGSFDGTVFPFSAGSHSPDPGCLRCAAAQIDTRIGDFDGTVQMLCELCKTAAQHGARILAVPHMALTGWPLRSLEARESFRAASADALAQLARDLQARGLGQMHVLLSAFSPLDSSENDVDNRADAHPQIVECVDGHVQPLAPAGSIAVVEIDGKHIGIAAVDDLAEPALHSLASDGLPQMDALVILAADAFTRERQGIRAQLAATLAADVNAPVAFINAVGGKDALIFDGGSFAVSSDGTLIAQAPQFASGLLLWDISAIPTSDSANFNADRAIAESGEPASAMPIEEQLYRACVLGVRDYAQTCGFAGAVLGLSGGIDSALVASIAVDALGAANVWGISMPSQYSSDGSKDDARDLAERTGCHYAVEPIETAFATIQSQLHLDGVAAENLQARLRGVTVMSYSNSRGLLALETGNKSEDACGYCTMYGDTVGGYAPIRDLLKTDVWALARWRDGYARAHNQTEPIPHNSIVKPPSAELRPGQKDSDSLPDYLALDVALEAYVRQGLSREQMLARGCDPQAVDAVLRLVGRAEWKRRQCPLGPRLTDWAFGDDRSYPLASAWCEH